MEGRTVEKRLHQARGISVVTYYTAVWPKVRVLSSIVGCIFFPLKKKKNQGTIMKRWLRSLRDDLLALFIRWRCTSKVNLIWREIKSGGQRSMRINVFNVISLLLRLLLLYKCYDHHRARLLTLRRERHVFLRWESPKYLLY